MGHEGHDHDHPHGHGHHKHDHDHGHHDHGHEGRGDERRAHGRAPAHSDHIHGHTEAAGGAHENPGGGPVADHRAHAPAHVASFVVTCSDSRDPARDETGRIVRRLLESQGHPIVGYRVISDDAEQIRAAVQAAAEAGARAIVFNGGTGVSARDVTVETLEALFERRLPGFGELFRMLSFEQIGSAAWLSRATAGVWKGVAIFALPGSPKGAQLGVERLILPELGHVVRELSR